MRTDWHDSRARHLLRRLFDAAVASADPRQVLGRHLPDRPRGRCVVVGAGKAAAAMAVAVETAWPDVPLEGSVVVPYGGRLPTRVIEVLEASHPVPDENSERAARRMLAHVAGLGPDDLALALISGGGSSLMALPVEDVTLADKQAVNRLLLASGLDIKTMNAVRRRLSAIKGGKLAAAAAPARVVTLAISDVLGDDPAAIASGPTIADPTADADLSDLARRLKPGLPQSVARRLLVPGVRLPREAVDYRMIATPLAALQAAADLAKAEGLDVRMLGDAIEGEAREVGAQMAERIKASVRPTVFLSGGETTVTLAGAKSGRGGRNTEFLLALATSLEGREGVWALAADTDGEDGAGGGAAGAICGPDSLARARERGLDAAGYLEAHDSGSFFDTLSDLIVTGPTNTNVNDFRAILVIP
jgi:glycerate 2-kinase